MSGKKYTVTVLPAWSPVELFLHMVAILFAALIGVAANHALIGGAWWVDLALMALGVAIAFAILPSAGERTGTFDNKAEAAAWLWSRP